MSTKIAALVLAIAASSAFVSAVGPFGLDNIQCQQQFLEVQANSTNAKFVGIDQTNLNQSSITALIALNSIAPSNFTEQHVNGTFPFSAKFNISGTLCTPIKGAKKNSALQLLVHGIGFDSSYWDFAFKPEYSYVRHAGSHGYTTFRYDRIGTGLSETPENGFDVAQAPTEVAVLTSINKLLRSTTLVGGQKWTKIVGIGHSYGSVQTAAVSANEPELYDAVILQGFSVNTTFLPNYLQGGSYSIARDIFPDRLASKPTTWLVTGSVSASQLPFFFLPFFAPGAFDLARETEQPVTLGSLFTITSVLKPAVGFNKPVQVVTSDKDFIFTGMNAFAGQNGLTIPAEVGPVLYPNASDFETYIPANTGHAVNQHFSASETYEVMISFIARHNL